MLIAIQTVLLKKLLIFLMCLRQTATSARLFIYTNYLQQKDEEIKLSLTVCNQSETIILKRPLLL